MIVDCSLYSTLSISVSSTSLFCLFCSTFSASLDPKNSIIGESIVLELSCMDDAPICFTLSISVSSTEAFGCTSCSCSSTELLFDDDFDELILTETLVGFEEDDPRRIEITCFTGGPLLLSKKIGDGSSLIELVLTIFSPSLS